MPAIYSKVPDTLRVAILFDVECSMLDVSFNLFPLSQLYHFSNFITTNNLRIFSFLFLRYLLFNLFSLLYSFSPLL